MSARKKKNLPGLQQIFDSIKDLLIAAKPQLDNPDPTVWPNLIEKLRQVTSLAESFTEQRPKSNKSWVQLSDELDQEGVSLWNISGLVQKTPHDEGRMLVAALRLAAFRLIEAGIELKPGIETLIHVLQLASKTGATLSEAGNGDVAGSVLASAARFEELLRNAEDPDGAHRVDKACATVVYFTSRMEAAWKEGNQSVAAFMSQKITDDEQRLFLLPPHDRERLACKLHDIGKSVLKTQGDAEAGTEGPEAVTWLQKAFAVADKLDDSVAHGAPELKISILRTMARAYFISRAYDRAEAALDELIPTIDAFSENGHSEHQELRWLRLAVLKRRKAGESALLDAFKSIIDHMTFCEANITDILQDLRTLNNHTLVTAVNHHCLQQLLASLDVNSDCVDRLLLSLIVHCSKDEDHSRAIAAIDLAFTATYEAEYNLLNLPATACLTLIWQYGDRHFNAKRWSAAADWFLAGSHQLFRAGCPASGAKCFRKAALCYIEQHEYAKASAVIRRCPSNEATTYYVVFLTAVHQGLDEEAIRAIHDMVNAADFDRKMLLLATQISHESEMKPVLLSVLEALLKTLKIKNSGEAVVEAMTLIRCIIRLVLKLLVEPASNKPVLIETLISHFHTAKVLAEAACAEKAIALIIKDVSWLWRTAYNCAVQGCAEWERSEVRISQLFEVARDLLTTCCDASPVDVDADLYLHLINASFSGVSGRVFAGRSTTTDGTLDIGRLRENATEIQTCKQKILSIMAKNKITDGDDILRVQYFLHVLRVFEAEMLAQLKEWDQLLQIVTEVVTSGPLGVGTYEAIADILWAEPDCPINTLLCGLEAILRASLDQNSVSVDKFSRWLRAICTIVLARNTPSDRLKAVGYVEQAVSVIEDNSEGDDVRSQPVCLSNLELTLYFRLILWKNAIGYWGPHTTLVLNVSSKSSIFPAHAIHWLPRASMLDEAKRWFESATVICRFVPGGKERADKACVISCRYHHF
ncbi:meiosis protein SPO22/ZIP4 like-domain-containing protein [Mycena albidolilacea]|uniref:Meiosis protein SPO22/ZIP4 like-domain-containing protein n=1 Tax=Mycena albidolilacea TaxID=1033008 RepID=A0AAD7AMP5_9AGAR|nr:meiosis protein SPO22/ZIP4 like-domain-containing protein [Mycena albidolilacea]